MKFALILNDGKIVVGSYAHELMFFENGKLLKTMDTSIKATVGIEVTLNDKSKLLPHLSLDFLYLAGDYSITLLDL